jgi:hypothetical protein
MTAGWTTEEPWFGARQVQGSLSSPKRPDRLWGPLSLIQWVPGVKELTAHPHIVPRLSICGGVPPLLHCLHGLHRRSCTFTLTSHVHTQYAAYRMRSALYDAQCVPVSAVFSKTVRLFRLK